MSRRDVRKHLKVLGRQFDALVASRACGPCSVCCTVLEVAELDKPVGVPCTELGEPGCRVYDRRPKACQAYLCSWKMGFGEPQHRPNELGLLLSPIAGTSPMHPGFVAHELFEGAWQSAEAWSLLRDMARSFVIVLMREGLPSRILAPEPRYQGLRAFIEGLRDEAEREKLGADSRLRPSPPTS